MKILQPSDRLYLKKSNIPNSGRGVFALKDIKKGEIIEECPIVKVSKNDTANLTESILNTYFFYFGENKDKLAVCLGFGSLYNHTREPNAVYEFKINEDRIDFKALRDIKKDEEITINYNFANPDDKTPLWFE